VEQAQALVNVARGLSAERLRDTPYRLCAKIVLLNMNLYRGNR
jgi:hypothetical protein